MKIDKPSTVHLVLNRPIRFVNVKNDKGETYYCRAFNKPVTKLQFNIADPGEYKIGCNSDFMSKVEDLQPWKELEMPEMQYDKRGKITVYYNNNIGNSPARINTSTRIIEYNDRFNGLPLFCQRFIMEHEKAHLMYKSEHFCDLYAFNQIMKRGGNKSSCLFTLMFVLKRTPANMERLKNIIGAITS